MTRARLALGAAALALGAGGAACKKTGDALVLLDLRASGTFAAPVVSVRLSVPWEADAGWPSHVLSSDLGAEGLKFGYYLPGGGGPITIQAEALDAASCVLGSGSLTLPAPPAGGTSQEMTLYVRPLDTQTCVDAGLPPPPDGGADAGADAASDGHVTDVSGDGATTDGATADGASTDAASTDAASTDAASTDAASTDAASTDAASTDAASTDAGVADGAMDALGDAATPDAATDAVDGPASDGLVSDGPASDGPADDAPASG
jgi:hypothetical protein